MRCSSSAATARHLPLACRSRCPFAAAERGGTRSSYRVRGRHWVCGHAVGARQRSAINRDRWTLGDHCLGVGCDHGAAFDACLDGLQIRHGLRPSELSTLRWRRWSVWIGRHPILILFVVGLPLLMLASQAVRLRTDLPRGAWLPSNVESVRVLNDLEAIGKSNLAQTIRIIVELPPA